MWAKGWGVQACLGAVCLAVLLAPWPAAHGAETAGMITEIRSGRGRVEARAAGGPDWRAAAPLQALRPGDAVRATADAWGVVVLSGGRGTVKVDAAGSPYMVAAPRPGETRTQKALGLLEASLSFLSSGAEEAPRARLSTRRVPAPVILSPRNGPVLPDAVAFEWLGTAFARYTLRVAGPGGVVLERTGVQGGAFAYPAGAPPLAPGVRYTVQVIGTGHPPQEAWFEVVEAARAQAIRRDLAEMELALGPAAPPNTLATLRAGFLASHGLLHNARLILLAALGKDPDEPALHKLLGNLYAKTGLPDQAARAYDEAQFLLTRGGKE